MFFIRANESSDGNDVLNKSGLSTEVESPDVY
jgi:hypothetical protein